MDSMRNSLIAVRAAILHRACQVERLLIIATLQNPETRDQLSHLLPAGQYDESFERALHRQHQEVLTDWLFLSTEEKIADLAIYAALQGETTAGILHQWFTRERRERLTPCGVPPSVQSLFDSEADVLLSVAAQ